MNVLRISAVASALSLTLLGALMSSVAVAQTSAPTQRIEIHGNPAAAGWIRHGDGYIPHVPFFGLRTRAEVIAEMFAWQTAGEWVFSGDESRRRDHFVSTKTRAEVLADASASRARGDFVRVGEDLLPRHVAEESGLIARRASPAEQNTAALSLSPAR